MNFAIGFALILFSGVVWFMLRPHRPERSLTPLSDETLRFYRYQLGKQGDAL